MGFRRCEDGGSNGDMERFGGGGNGRSESWWIVGFVVRENRDGWWWWRRMKVSVWKMMK